MRNTVLRSSAKTVGKALDWCAKIIYLYTQNVFLLQRVYKTRALYTAYSVFLPSLSHSKKQVFQSVNTVFLPTIHTTYKDKQKIIKLI
ncbi:MAG: hypothetical protein JWO35_175 [Candidatus Saccharibacteria bacterium]|nr:hypothetical protein [Candidatus Saccharibacteria bacterium]